MGGVFTRRENKPGMIIIIVSFTFSKLSRWYADDTFSSLALLHCRSSLFHLQTQSNVRAKSRLPILTRSKIPYHIRYPHHHSDLVNDYQRPYVHIKFCTGSTTLHCEHEGGEWGGKANNDGNAGSASAAEVRRTNTKPDDNRIRDVVERNHVGGGITWVYIDGTVDSKANSCAFVDQAVSGVQYPYGIWKVVPMRWRTFRFNVF